MSTDLDLTAGNAAAEEPLLIDVTALDLARGPSDALNLCVREASGDFVPPRAPRPITLRVAGGPRAMVEAVMHAGDAIGIELLSTVAFHGPDGTGGYTATFTFNSRPGTPA